MANTTGASRVFKIGSTTIHEDDSMSGLSNEQCQQILKARFPEIANATVTEKTRDGVREVSFIPRAGKKG